ncbi:hypothetical protein GOC53_28005 [Sinorhizobium medicae]|uniref:hypothetical protein n=1 Tax=Rhizobium meliloti TaxID=382 RepID=UPI000B497EE6|nr:hypothetical protein [Sinorhizobium meliloti]ASP98418.1 hypothetical protein CDO24_13845 [Sinorhizobium meliloti]MDX0494068.1 hypothetical protein [Sinorhizobium medicae]MQV66163.1 hypothetical protein [Sinorhizobium meliloti]RVQ39346.1 hypothetical protein CN065_14210 [Sinorhizobium meliloti]
MAPRKPKPAAEPVVVAAEPMIEQPVIHYIANPVTVAHRTPKTRDEIVLHDAVRKALSEVETLVMDFVSGVPSQSAPPP